MKQSALYKADFGMIVKYPDFVAVVLSRDYEKNTILLKFFPTLEDADNFVHSSSKHQYPEWHKKYCNKC